MSDSSKPSTSVQPADCSCRRKPEWLKVRMPGTGEFTRVHKLVSGLRLHTVCQEAHCPNMGECWAHGTATFMILGDVCTRNCRFCATRKGVPKPLDWDEPRRIGEAVEALGLQYVVITSVTRDDLEHGGAPIFVETVREIRRRRPDARIELLIPDFNGNWDDLCSVADAAPDVLNHNLETVPRLYPLLRPQADLERSLELLRRAKERNQGLTTKSGIMVGAGEEWAEVLETMRRICETGCDILTIGQYLRPSPEHHPIYRYYHPDEFAELGRLGLEMGFGHVESGPLVRSSYHAWSQTQALEGGKTAISGKTPIAASPKGGGS
jgi:lipoic acid synthetase